MKFQKVYEDFKKYLSKITVIAVNDNEIYATNGHVLLRVEDVPVEFLGKEQNWSWECSKVCERANRIQCEHDAGCCSNYVNGACVQHEIDCEKEVNTCGKGVFVQSGWTEARLFPSSIKPMLKQVFTTEIILKKGIGESGRRKTKTFNTGTTIDINLFKLFKGKGLNFYQAENIDTPVYVRNGQEELLGIVMPLRIFK